MAQAGVTDIADYEEFLMFEESLQLKSEQNGSEVGKRRSQWRRSNCSVWWQQTNSPLGT